VARKRPNDRAAPSLSPLSVDEALAALLKALPPPKKRPKGETLTRKALARGKQRAIRRR